jgi:hypothetical protein
MKVESVSSSTQHNIYKKHVDLLLQQGYSLVVASTIRDAVLGMSERLRHEWKRVQDGRREMAELAPAYNRYLDLQEEQAHALDRIDRLTTLLPSDDLHEVSVTTPEFEPADLLDDIPLWEAMVEYLQHVPKARVSDLLGFCKFVGVKNATRQGIESALRYHSDRFHVTKSSYEKFISLRSNSERRSAHAASTKKSKAGAKKVKTR